MKYLIGSITILALGTAGIFVYNKQKQVDVPEQEIVQSPIEVVVAPVLEPTKKVTSTTTVKESDGWKELDESIPNWINSKKISIESIAKLQADLVVLEKNKHTVVFEYVGARPYMDAYGIQLAQNYMDIAKEYKAALDDEIIVVQDGIIIIDKLIAAIQSRNDSALEDVTVLIESNVHKQNMLMRKTVQLNAKELESFKIVSKYKLGSF